MIKNNSVNIILPAYNEEKSIAKFILDLESLNIFEKIIVVDNNSTDNTKNEILKTSAIYYSEKVQGFGAAIKKGLNNCTSDIIVICEPDGSFLASDVLMILNELENYDIVFSTRTFSNMKNYLKFGNKIYGFFISILFGGPLLTDVGSSLRAFKRNSIKNIIKNLKSDGPELQIELTIDILKSNLKIIEKKITYKDRIGISSYTGNFYSSSKVLIKFSKVVILKFFKFF